MNKEIRLLKLTNGEDVIANVASDGPAAVREATIPCTTQPTST